MPTTRTFTAADVAKAIDHSLLQPFLARDAVAAGLRAAAELRTASACVRPCDVPAAAAALAGTGVAVCTVIGFPHGTTTTETKLAEAAQALDGGATELDVVINVGWLKSGDDAAVGAELGALQRLAAGRGATVKVICENAYLTPGEKRRAYAVAIRAGVGFLKTSTGYAPSGSTPGDLRLMRDCIASAGAGGRVSVKAAGGIRTLDALLEALACGATRVGASATAELLAAFAARTAGTGGVLALEVEDPQPLLPTEAGEGGAGEAAGQGGAAPAQPQY